MKKNHANFRKACAAYCDAKAAGKSNLESRQIAGKFSDDEGGVINHAQAGLAWYADDRNPKGIVPGAFSVAGMPEDEAAKTVGLLRAGLHPEAMGVKYSEGDIMILCGSNEPQGHGALTASRTRKLFGAATGLAFEGTRMNRGGRFLGNDPTLYVGNHKGLGTESPRPLAEDREALIAGAQDYKTKLPAALKVKVTSTRSRARKPSAK